ncbi:BspA family leucine-rich repeat surface protein [Sinomicrobium weinanense]|uniref:DUF285 domain-containing protein n=1 Tax=Sinomicrobium weinanense TaxID=2842200 RepID=A0A926JVI9_9FLAO|nr:BspA family leucine-rich repeat surface protein [Sinomicrobium weinanense]MBC9797946.1 DUF285 domain-containing protein [Sinomicrobium weinanense]MBU3123262.1 DUF285 domain-containing protein [Sinomicrobium weinanense]
MEKNYLISVSFLFLVCTLPWTITEGRAQTNTDPTISGLPSDITVEEDSQDNVFDISSATINDSDAGSGELTLILNATGGIFDIAAGTGITITGHASSHLTLTGNLADLNHYIDIPSNIWFRPDENLYGDNAAVVEVFINDNGNTGTGGGNDVFIGTVNVDITPINDAPEVSLPATIQVTENTDSALTGISFADVDAESGTLIATFSVAAGTLTATSGGGVTTTGSGTGTLTIAGTLINLNAFLSGSNVTFLNPSGNTNNQTLTVSVDDNGNTGNGGNLNVAGTATITVLPATIITPGDPGNFITTWKTDNPGDSEDNQITIPIHQDGGYNFTIAWGDGNQAAWQDGDDPEELTHTYAAPGTYTVEITGDFPRIFFDGGGDRQKILSIEQWGNIAWSSMEDAFDGASNLMGNATDAPDLSGVTSLVRMFQGASVFNGDIGSWDVSGVTNMSGMFTGANSFNQDIGSWNVSNVTNMDGMLVNAYAFNQDISSWQVQNVTNMNSMFRNAVGFSQDLSGWNVSKVTIMQRMLFNTPAFNVNIGNWDVSNVTDMFEMLSNSGLSPENYDAVLTGWAGQAVQNGITLGADGLEYCASASERQSLIDNHSWTILGDTQTADCGGNLNPDANNVLYVDINVNTEAAGYTGTGDSWANAVPRLQDALSWAADHWDGEADGSLQIWVADGIYYPDEGANQADNDRNATFQLVNSVEVYGGFSGTETALNQRDWAANVAVLDGDIDQDGTIENNAYHVVTGSNTNTTPVLNGFTITGGHANGSSEKNGGGMYNFGGSSTLTNLIFRDNRADQDGGGMFNSGSSSVLRNVVFTGNQSDQGAGFFGQASMPKLINVTFNGNTAATEGGAITSGWNGTLELINVLIWGNEANGSSTSASASIDSRGGGITVSNSLVANSGGSDNWDVGIGEDGGNNVDMDPEFISTTPGQAGYLQLGAASPAVNGGNNNAYSDAGGDLENDMDLAGNPRVAGGTIDMGGYEFQGEPTPVIVSLSTPDTITVDYGTSLNAIEASLRK